MSKICPTCHQTSSDEEFCPHDGSLLVATESPPPPPPPVAEPQQAPSAEVVVRAEDAPAPGSPRPPLSTRFVQGFSKLLDRVTGHSSSAPDQKNPLPPYEIEHGWRICGNPISTNASDVWPLAMETPSGGTVLAYFRRFRTPALTPKTVYETLATTTGSASVHLYSYGTVDAGGARLDYEITARTSGQSLQEWNKATPPSEDKAAFLEPRLRQWLQTLHAEGLTPFAFSPNSLWLTEGEEHIVLASLGAVAALDQVTPPRFEADLANSAGLTLPYAAPELAERRVIAANSAVFAIGQILAAALFGDAHEYAFIRNGSVPFAGIENPQLARLLMGTLWPTIEGRWSSEDFFTSARAPETAPAIPPWASLCPGAASTAFMLNGQGYWLAEDLIAAAAQHWEEAILQLDEILTWLTGTRFSSTAELLRQGLLEGRSRDWTLIRLGRLITPEAPLVWRGHSFTDQDVECSLIALAQQALSNSPEADAATADLRHLFEADLRGAFAPAPPSTPTA